MPEHTQEQSQWEEERDGVWLDIINSLQSSRDTLTVISSEPGVGLFVVLFCRVQTSSRRSGQLSCTRNPATHHIHELRRFYCFQGRTGQRGPGPGDINNENLFFLYSIHPYRVAMIISLSTKIQSQPHSPFLSLPTATKDSFFFIPPTHHPKMLQFFLIGLAKVTGPTVINNKLLNIAQRQVCVLLLLFATPTATDYYMYHLFSLPGAFGCHHQWWSIVLPISTLIDHWQSPVTPSHPPVQNPNGLLRGRLLLPLLLALSQHLEEQK